MLEKAITADRVEVAWDRAKGKWLVRIQAGEEVIRRHSDLPQDAGDETLRTAALGFIRDEGYEAGSSPITVQR